MRPLALERLVLEQPEQEKLLLQRPPVPVLEPLALLELAGSQSSWGGDTLDGRQRKPLIPRPGRV
jgi:hypothetical protein